MAADHDRIVEQTFDEWEIAGTSMDQPLSRKCSLARPPKPDRPQVSVIMPTFNAASTLLDAARSVLDQSLSQVELIIVDDGSSDDSPGIASALASEDSRVRAFRLTANLGPAAARNVALRNANGVWIAPVDADDWIARERFEVLCSTGERHNADLVADAIHFAAVDGQNRRDGFAKRSRLAPAHDIRELTIDLLIASDIPLNGARSYGYLKPLIRRDFLRRWNLAYEEGLRFAEDLNLYARTLVYGARFLLHPGCYYEYRQTPISASRNLDTLPRCAADALANNQRMRTLVRSCGRDDLAALLDEHEQRWSTVLWFNRIKLALRNRRLVDALRATLECPHAMAAVFAFARDRSKAKRHRDLTSSEATTSFCQTPAKR